MVTTQIDKCSRKWLHFSFYIDIYIVNNDLNKYMNMKNRVRLTEGDLHRIVRESVNRVVRSNVRHRRNVREWVDEDGDCLGYLEDIESTLNNMLQGEYGSPTENDSFWSSLDDALSSIREAISELD